MKAVGARLPRYDGLAHVTGQTVYVDDVRVPDGNLWAKALRSPRALRPDPWLRRAQGGGAPRRARHRHARGRAEERLRPPRGARRSCRRAPARRRRGSLQGPADRGRRRRQRGRGPGRGRGDRGRLRGARAAARHPNAFDADAPQIHPWGNWYPFFGGPDQGPDRRQIRKGDVDAAFDQADVVVQGVYRPQAIEHCPLETQVAMAVPEASGRLVIYSCTQAMYFSMGVVAAHLAGAAQQAQARRRHGRRRVRGQGRQRGGDALRAARAEDGAGGEVALDAGGGVPRLLDARAVAHRDRRRGDERRLDPRSQDAHAARLGRLRAVLAVRPDEARVPPRGRVHRPERPLRRLRHLHEPRAHDGDARLRRHVRVVRGRDPHERGSHASWESIPTSSG